MLENRLAHCDRRHSEPISTAIHLFLVVLRAVRYPTGIEKIDSLEDISVVVAGSCARNLSVRFDYGRG